jgi:hypothetical protein
VTDRNLAIVTALEPLALMAVGEGRMEIRSWVIRLYAEPLAEHDINEILPFIDARALRGLKNERYAFELAATRLREITQ